MQVHQSPSVRPIIAWTDILLVGHPQIDADHRRMFEIANQVHAGIREQHDDSLVRRVLAELSDYTMTHFAREEELMKDAGLPGLEDHRFEHQLITYRLHNLRREAACGREGLADELELFLDRWLARHILTADAQAAAALREARQHRPSGA